MTAVSNLGALLQPSSVAIFLQPPGLGFVPLLLAQANIPSPTRVRLDLAETETFEKRFTITRNPVERVTAQNRIAEPERLTITGMLSANPIFAPLQYAAIARLDRKEMFKLRTLLENELSFIVTPERPFANMSCVSYREEYDAETGNGVRLTLQFEQITIALPGQVAPLFDNNALALGAGASDQLGPQTPTEIPDAGGI